MIDMTLFRVFKFVSILLSMVLILMTLRRRGFRDSLTRSLIAFLGFSLIFDIGTLFKVQELPFALHLLVATNLRYFCFDVPCIPTVSSQFTIHSSTFWMVLVVIIEILNL